MLLRFKLIKQVRTGPVQRTYCYNIRPRGILCRGTVIIAHFVPDRKNFSRPLRDFSVNWIWPWAIFSVDNPVFQVGKRFIKKNFFHCAFAFYFANWLPGKSLMRFSDLPRKDWKNEPKGHPLRRNGLTLYRPDWNNGPNEPEQRPYTEAKKKVHPWPWHNGVW